MRVLEGTVHVLVGDTVTEVHAGDWHVRPHGIIHTFWNAGDVPARIIDMYLNQDLLSMFDEYTRIANKLKSKGLGMESPEGMQAWVQTYNATVAPAMAAPASKKKTRGAPTDIRSAQRRKRKPTHPYERREP